MTNNCITEAWQIFALQRLMLGKSAIIRTSKLEYFNPLHSIRTTLLAKLVVYFESTRATFR
ncbi:hypothetical protein T03_15037 [Trichinella britovi]|uniref:Uncharacterized protein n=1 Tax=Trichinella britovi TaxID=45882 RepID=A0A0V1CZ63_TRIBR|nr:hypothetical protein T03_15037 [Trichinella britovi]